MHRILIIDDDKTVCKSLKLLLSKSGFEVESINLPSLAIESIQRFAPDLVLLDLNFTIDTSGKQGMRILSHIQKYSKDVIVILITGWATLQLAVEGMKNGAKDFLAKPWDNNHLLSSINTALALYGKDQRQNEERQQESHIVGESGAFKQVMELVDRVSSTHAGVLITGASGSGKEVIAEAIHSRSKRKDKPFIKVNLGGIPSSLFESEMFGHVRGAFTDASDDREGRFAKADSGTIFLDEIGDLALESQVKLLRVLQEKAYEALGSSKTIKTDVRVISATHRPLESMVAEGTFREDLYYRINLIKIDLPSLSERREDIPLLVRHFARWVSEAYDFELPVISNEAVTWLSHQTFDGNIRQLRNIVERTLLLTQDKKILEIRDFQDNMIAVKKRTDKIALPNIGEVTLEELERRMIEKTLAFHDHSVSKTARSLGLTRSSLYRRMEKFGM